MRVYDTDTKENLEGAAVELFGSDGTSLSVQTGVDGMYELVCGVFNACVAIRGVFVQKTMVTTAMAQ